MKFSLPKNNDAPSTALIAAGYLMIGVGLVHVLVMLGSGGPWEGPVSWRKPILFGVSTGLTALSLGWLVNVIGPAQHDTWAGPLVAIALVVEVGLITLQRWRGVASHFNTSTLLNTAIDVTMTSLITIAAVYIFVLTWRCFGKFTASTDLRLAVQSGMILLSVSCVIGFLIFSIGQYQASLGLNPEVIGNAGVLKFPHGIAIHAIQFLPVLCWALAKLNIPAQRRRSAVAWTTASIGTFLAFGILQTATGRARFDMTMASAAVLWIAACLLVPALQNLRFAVLKS